MLFNNGKHVIQIYLVWDFRFLILQVQLPRIRGYVSF